jgi:hypothetical protein
MVLTRSDGAGYLVFHWPNESPQERVKIARVQIESDDLRLLES